MKCPHCGAINDGGSRFCMSCGKQIPQCPTCGRVLTNRDPFCMHDGTPLPPQILALIPEEIQLSAVPVGNEPVQEVTYCMNCGQILYNCEDFCENCKAAAIVGNTDFTDTPAVKQKNNKGSLVAVIVLILLLFGGIYRL